MLILSRQGDGTTGVRTISVEIYAGLNLQLRNQTKLIDEEINYEPSRKTGCRTHFSSFFVCDLPCCPRNLQLHAGLVAKINS